VAAHQSNSLRDLAAGRREARCIKIGPHLWAARRQERLGPSPGLAGPSGDSTIRRLSAAASSNLQSVKFFSAGEKA
jgi:hypothetical protein